MPSRTLAVSLLTLTLARLIINLARRFTYPFIPEIGRQLAVPLISVQSALAANAGVGIASPLFGPLSEHHGRKRVMLGALVTVVSASLVAAFLPQFAVFAVVMIVLGVAKMVYDPAMQAYIGDRVPYSRRGFAIGMTELSWAGSLLVAAPLGAYLLGRHGVQGIFAFLAVASLAALVGVWLLLPADHPEHHHRVTLPSPLQSWRALRANPSAFGALGYLLFLVMANEVFFINYGAWMESAFQLDLASLGGVTLVIAAAEVVGEFLVIGVADRVGKRRMALMGVIVSSATYFMLPYLTVSLPATIAGVFIAFMFVEIAIVASIPLFTEFLPSARSVMMSSSFAAHSLGRLVGAVIGGAILTATASFPATGFAAALFGVIATGMLWRFLHERHAS